MRKELRHLYVHACRAAFAIVISVQKEQKSESKYISANCGLGLTYTAKLKVNKALTKFFNHSKNDKFHPHQTYLPLSLNMIQDSRANIKRCKKLNY